MIGARLALYADILYNGQVRYIAILGNARTDGHIQSSKSSETMIGVRLPLYADILYNYWTS